MSSHTLFIKNMVCNRCIKVVEKDINKLSLDIESIELGKVVLKKPVTTHKLDDIRQILSKDGFELIDDKKSRIINKIKTLIIEDIYYDKEVPGHMNFSDYLSKEIGYDYTYLSKLFSSIEGITIEKYTILQKIERVKELLVYNELSLGEIAYQLGYSIALQEKEYGIEMSALDPVASMMAVGNENRGQIAEEIRTKLDKVIENL